MPTLLQILPADLLGKDMASVLQAFQTAGYVLLGLVGLVLAVWVYFWPYSEYFAVERNLPGESSRTLEAVWRGLSIVRRDMQLALCV